jgi:hypothetical protein
MICLQCWLPGLHVGAGAGVNDPEAGKNAPLIVNKPRVSMHARMQHGYNADNLHGLLLKLVAAGGWWWHHDGSCFIVSITLHWGLAFSLRLLSIGCASRITAHSNCNHILYTCESACLLLAWFDDAMLSCHVCAYWSMVCAVQLLQLL